MSLRLVPDELWALVKPSIPRFKARAQGGGTAPVDDRAAFTAIVYVLTSGCGWRELPPSFGVTVPTAHRRFTEWTKAALWRRLHQAVLAELGSRGEVDWSRAILDAASVRAKKGANLTGPNPVDRGKPGSKIHVVSDRAGIPLAVGVSAANLHDSQALKPMLMAIPRIRSRRGPRRFRPAKLRADKAYDIDHLRRWVRQRGIIPRIARKGIESSQRLGRHRWVIERTISWLTGYRRLTIRYERQADNYCGFLTFAATLTCFKRLNKLTT
ncbi:IS5 family transposase [Saccharothrix isguenensis]